MRVHHQVADCRTGRPSGQTFSDCRLVAAGGACAFWWSRDPGHAFMVAVRCWWCLSLCAVAGHAGCLLASAGELARRGVLVRRLHALETLVVVDTVVFARPEADP